MEKELSKEAPSVASMVNDVAKRLLLLKADKIPMEQYKSIVSIQLHKKKLAMDHIEAIIKRMEEISNGSEKEKTDTK